MPNAGWNEIKRNTWPLKIFYKRILERIDQNFAKQIIDKQMLVNTSIDDTTCGKNIADGR